MQQICLTVFDVDVVFLSFNVFVFSPFFSALFNQPIVMKAVTKAKLGYNPLELDPEEMVAMARYVSVVNINTNCNNSILPSH